MKEIGGRITLLSLVTLTCLLCFLAEHDGTKGHEWSQSWQEDLVSENGLLFLHIVSISFSRGRDKHALHASGSRDMLPK